MTIGAVSPPSEGNNPELATMHRDLVALVVKLEEALDRAPDFASITVITDQIVEVNARVTATGRLLLVEQTEEIVRLAQAFRMAMPEIEQEIEKLDDIRRVVGSLAGVLEVVDETLELAALMCR